jgi:Translocase of chloroplast 159/132, membrane anchor domain
LASCDSGCPPPPTAQSEVEGSVWHSSKHVTTGSLEVQSIGTDFLYTTRAESRLKLHKKDKLALGVLASRLVEDSAVPTKVGRGPCPRIALLHGHVFLVCLSVCLSPWRAVGHTLFRIMARLVPLVTLTTLVPTCWNNRSH